MSMSMLHENGYGHWYGHGQKHERGYGHGHSCVVQDTVSKIECQISNKGQNLI
jgi:hypothetical protein